MISTARIHIVTNVPSVPIPLKNLKSYLGSPSNTILQKFSARVVPLTYFVEKVAELLGTLPLPACRKITTMTSEKKINKKLKMAF